MDRGGGDLHTHTWIFLRQQIASVACIQHVSERVYAARVTLLFSAKMTERLEQRYCIKFCQKLGDRQVEAFGSFSGFLMTMTWASHKLRSGTTDSNLAALRWRATLVLVGTQQGEMTSSLTKCGLWSCSTVVSPSENLPRRWV